MTKDEAIKEIKRILEFHKVDYEKFMNSPLPVFDGSAMKDLLTDDFADEAVSTIYKIFDTECESSNIIRRFKDLNINIKDNGLSDWMSSQAMCCTSCSSAYKAGQKNLLNRVMMVIGQVSKKEPNLDNISYMRGVSDVYLKIKEEFEKD